MKRKYKIVSLLLSLLLTFPLSVACGNSDQGSDENQDKDEKTDYTEILGDYVSSDCTIKYSDDDLQKVNITPTFDITKYTNSAEEILIPYYTYTDGMVLQRDQVLKIYGTAPKAVKYIAVSFKDRVFYGTVTAATSGVTWEVYLPKLTAGGPYTMEIISNIGRVSISDVYVGEVFLCSGQSNMEFTSYWNSSKCSDLYEDTEACKSELIRLCKAQQQRVVGEPTQPQQFNTYLTWESAQKASIRSFSTVGYIFGKEIQRQLGCPVGLICNAMGGSLIEYWMSNETYEEYHKTYPSYIDKTNDVLTNSLGFNGSIAPLEGYSFRGVIWYQGESNVTGNQKYYINALRALTSNWRQFFNNDKLTFTFCELARYNQNVLGYSTINEKIGEFVKEDDYSAVAINVDGGDWDDIHPAEKHYVGNRAAWETLRLFFGKEEKCAPVIENTERIDEKTVKLTLDKEVVLKNKSNGFEVKTSLGWEFNPTVTVEGKVITITYKDAFTAIRYGYRAELTTEVKEDVSKFVTVFDLDDYPMDLFLLDNI